jgi:signal transduction histidine kinase
MVSGRKVLGNVALFLEKPLPKRVWDALTLLLALGGVFIENRLLSEETETSARRQERLRIAQEIHNTLTQDLAGVELYLEVLRRKLSSGKVERRNIATILERVSAAVHRCLLQSRDVLRTLWESVEERKGFAETLVQVLEYRLALGNQKIRHRVAMRIPEYLVPPGIRELFLQVAAEALNNTLKYAQARNVAVKIGLSRGKVYLLFHDDGQGMEGTGEGKDGHGLDLLREQVLLRKGILRVRSGKGQGTTVKVMVPLYGK